MNYYQAEQFLLDFAKLPRKEYLADPKHCDWYLKRLQFFLDIIGNPEAQIPHYIHITGTSGKGSVATYLQSILVASGKRVGLSTSPHPTYITERWKINNREMTRTEFASLVSWLKNKYKIYTKKTPFDNLSLFEFTEALGLKYFADKKIEWLVTEVGAGGRYDSSNIIPHKDIAVITNIGLDHVGIIGNNKSEIAYEKSGIIKTGCKVFTAETDPKILKIIKKECALTKTKLFAINKPRYSIVIPTDRHRERRNPLTQTMSLKHSLRDPSATLGMTSGDESGTIFKYKNQTYTLTAPGEHQIVNAILCIEIARALKINNNTIKKGLASAKQPLRFEIVNKNPLIILDGAHNPDKMKTTVVTLRDSSATLGMTNDEHRLHLLVGFSADKNIKQMVKQLSALKPTTITCSQTSAPGARPAISPNDLAKLFRTSSPKATIKTSPNHIQAYKTICKTLKTNDVLLVTGSIYFSGQLRPII
ncbi:MAG: hypothetical protein A2538_00010 [Candidatus Magasanikbacteria bacterium RIFOXYD2_FULL_41_14]|uniref:tetrahydrofolate synthase n=1 Tax=Candidatus Magasanikbacteria bacterium RIFOXYD2_FULL_41_14 TaxID=1798709 RepID=A0A1F6PEC9_9BACT|nr:MAG: hypothetical protein A2538_00010 [Candidatus Magasanikbacteria bacterium RIFOXYD2_FULL_41_14]